jgi:serine phosphatase RsbU (regulator of sigma subunit)
MDKHSTDKESTKSRTGERGQGNEKKRQREREEEQRERGSPQENRERERKHRGKNVHSTSTSQLHHRLRRLQESIGKKRKTKINTSYQRSSLSSESAMTGRSCSAIPFARFSAR